MEARRIPTPVLAGMVVAGLAFGALWWTGAAPPATTPAGTPRTLPVPRADPPLVVAGPVAGPDQAGLAGTPGDAGPDSFRVELDPDQLDWLLPAPAGGIVLREAVALSPAATDLMGGPASPGAYTLEVVCTGGGEIDVGLEAEPGTSVRLSMACDATVVAEEVDLQPGYAGIRLTHRRGAVVIAVFQLVRR